MSLGNKSRISVIVDCPETWMQKYIKNDMLVSHSFTESLSSFCIHVSSYDISIELEDTVDSQPSFLLWWGWDNVLDGHPRGN